MSTGYSTIPGFINKHNQKVIRNTGKPGTDNLQTIYELECQICHQHYGANGSDNWQRKCPECQGGKPGLPLE